MLFTAMAPAALLLSAIPEKSPTAVNTDLDTGAAQVGKTAPAILSVTRSVATESTLLTIVVRVSVLKTTAAC